MWIECAPVCINFFLNYMKLVLPFIQTLCTVYTSALCMQRSSNCPVHWSPDALYPKYLLTQSDPDLQKHIFIVDIAWAFLLFCQSETLISPWVTSFPLSDLFSFLSKNQLVSFTSIVKARFMWVQVLGSWKLKSNEYLILLDQPNFFPYAAEGVEF